MDFKQILQLAGENSAFAKKKAERLGAQDDNKGINVSSSAVAKYLAKQQMLKEKQRAEEEEARRKRIKARLEASLGKKKVESKKQPEHIKYNVKKKEVKDDNIKFKIDANHKIKHSNSSQQKKHGKSSELRSDSISKKSKNISNLSNEHRKDISKSSNEHRKDISKPSNEHRKEVNRTKNAKDTKQTKKQTSASGLSFTDLMKLAKFNSEHPGMKKNLPDINLKRPMPNNQVEEQYDPDRFIKTKVRKKDLNKEVHHNSSKNTNPTKKDKHKEKTSSKLKDTKHNNTKIPSSISTILSSDKISKKPQEPIKRGLVLETISTTNSSVPMKTLSSSYKQVKSTGDRTIASQNHVLNTSGKQTGKMKKCARDIEAEFEKEERALARKRKLFEIRRVTGNMHMNEEDLFGEDDYDLEEEDEEDANFIDDSEQAEDVSKHIRSIFGYDRRRYLDSDDDEDLKNMESNYSQIEKEEARSARIAKIEDDYEKMKEEEEILRAKMKMKKTKL